MATPTESLDLNAMWYGRVFRGRIQLRRVPLNSGGYTAQGRYFGTGAPLYLYYNLDEVNPQDAVGDDPNFEGYIRGADRAAAIAKLRKQFPLARFPGDKVVRTRKANARRVVRAAPRRPKKSSVRRAAPKHARKAPRRR